MFDKMAYFIEKYAILRGIFVKKCHISLTFRQILGYTDYSKGDRND